MMIAVGQARDKIIREALYGNYRLDIFDISGEFVTDFEDILVEEDTKKKLFFSTLPAKQIDLPHNIGIYMVSFMKDQQFPFTPVNSGFLGLYRNLKAFNLERRCGYWPEKDRIYYVGVNETTKADKVLIKMIVSSVDIGADDYFPVPADREMDVVALSVQLYQPQKQKIGDELNDEVDA